MIIIAFEKRFTNYQMELPEVQPISFRDFFTAEFWKNDVVKNKTFYIVIVTFIIFFILSGSYGRKNINKKKISVYYESLNILNGVHNSIY